MEIWQQVIFIGSIAAAILAILNSGGKLTQIIKTPFVRIEEHAIKNDEEIKKEVQEFISEHSGCKDSTKEHLEKHDQLLASDLESLKRLDKDVKVLFKMMNTTQQQEIYGDYLDQIKKDQDELHNHILNR